MWSDESGVNTGLTLAGRYRLVGRVATGGFGTVFRARDENLGREVAIKVLRPVASDPDETAQALARFDREARLLAGIRHPHVVAVYDRGTDGAVAFVVMELLPGPNVATVVERDHPLPLPQVLRYATQVAAGLAHLHGLSRPVIHRDLKPQNLVLDGDVVKVCDFGVAIAPGVPRHTQAGLVIGSPQYMSPEQCQGEQLTPASDIYAFGAVLYCLLAGEAPFSAAAGFASCTAQIVHDPPDDVRRFRPDTPDPLAELVHAMLAKAAPARPDAAAVARDLAATARLPEVTEAATADPDPIAGQPVPTTAAVTEDPGQPGGADIGQRPEPNATPEALSSTTLTRPRASTIEGARAELAEAERLLAEGEAGLAAAGFVAVARRLDATGHGQEPERFAAEFGRVRAADALGNGSEAAARWGRLLARAAAALGEQHDLVRQVRHFGNVRSQHRSTPLPPP